MGPKIINLLLDYYNKFIKYEFVETNIPISITHQKEQEYRILRENKCSFLNFEYPSRSALVYDFIIKGKKFQDIMLGRGRSISSVSHGMRPSVELTTQTFDPAFGIGKLLFEIVHLLLTLSFALTELQ